jgi:hypothetical protein
MPYALCFPPLTTDHRQLTGRQALPSSVFCPLILCLKPQAERSSNLSPRSAMPYALHLAPSAYRSLPTASCPLSSVLCPLSSIFRPLSYCLQRPSVLSCMPYAADDGQLTTDGSPGPVSFLAFLAFLAAATAALILQLLQVRRDLARVESPHKAGEGVPVVHQLTHIAGPRRYGVPVLFV